MSIIEYNEEMVYGIGYNSLTGKVRGRAVDNLDDIEGVSLDDLPDTQKENNSLKYNACGQKASLILQSISSNEQLSDFFNVSGSGSLEMGLFGKGFNVSAKGEFCQQNKINKYSTYLIVRYVIRNAARRIKHPRLTSESLTVLKDQGVDQFRKKYGDEFIVGFVSGGEYMSVIEIEGNSREERETIAGEISAGFNMINWKIGGGGSISTNKENSSSQSKFKIQYYKAGGNKFGFSGTLEEIVRDINEFAENVRKNWATNYLAITTDYDTLYMPTTHTIVDSELEDQKTALNKLAQKRIRYISHMSDIDFIVQSGNQFELKIEREKLINMQDTLTKELEIIEKMAISCVRNPSVLSDEEFELNLYKHIKLLDLPTNLNRAVGK